MAPLILFPIDNPGYQAVADSAPLGWQRQSWSHEPNGKHLFCVALCDQAAVKNLTPIKRRIIEEEIEGPVIPILYDVSRQPLNFVELLGGPPVVTMDAPARDATWLFAPVSPVLYNTQPAPEREGVIFPGRINYKCRENLISQLEYAGVTIIPRDDSGRSYADYVDDLRSAVAVVNLCADRKTGMPAMKARVIETCMAGALLLEERNTHTATWLKQDEEYLSWSSVGELSDIIEHIKAFPVWARDIAAKGNAAVRERLNAVVFWDTVAQLAGVAVGPQ